MDNKVSVKDYAELKQTTVQAVYKRINKGTLKTVKEKINGKDVLFVLLDEDNRDSNLNPSLTDNQPKEVELNQDLNLNSTPNQPNGVENEEEDLNPSSTPKEEPQADQSIIIFLQKQLEEKDRQIAEKDKQIEKIQQLLDQEQHLHLSTKLLLKEYTDKEQNIEEEPQSKQEEKNKIVADQEPQKKRSWLYRFFFEG